MGRKLVFSIFCCILHVFNVNGYSAMLNEAPPVKVATMTFYEKKDSDTTTWIKRNLYINSYTSEGAIDYDLCYLYVSSATGPETYCDKKEYVYNTSGNLTAIQYFSLSDSVWIQNTNQETKCIYKDNLHKSVFYVNHNFTSNNHYEYDTQGKVVKWATWEEKVASKNHGKDSTHIVYTYDENGRVSSEVEYRYSFKIFPYFHKDVDTLKARVHEYTDNGLKAKSLTKILRVDDSTWIDHIQYLYEYNEDNTLADATFQTAAESGFVNCTRVLYTYNQSGSVSTLEKQYWDSTEVWKTSSVITRTYYDFGPLHEEIETNPRKYMSHAKRVYTYVNQTQAKDNIISSNKNTPVISVISDPINHRATIYVTVANEIPVSFEIYSVNGRMIKRICRNQPFKAGTTALLWNGLTDNGKSTGSGVYLYRIKMKDNQRCGRVVF